MPGDVPKNWCTRRKCLPEKI
nr:unnamed protein product [Callosobruchus chinensis]